MQEELAEDANEIVRALIRDEDAFIKHAVEADGRGHFPEPLRRRGARTLVQAKDALRLPAQLGLHRRGCE